MLTQAPRGTRDVLPKESGPWQALEAIMRETAAKAGYREIRTPVFEHTELFLRGVGDTTDIVQKEMYTFKDKGDRSITLKPEGTAGAVRALIEHSLYAEALPVKMYYLSTPIFRYETPQSGRFREHHQFGLECFGAQSPSVDAEIITLAFRMIEKLGVTNLTVNINSIGCPKCRPAYHQKLKEFLGGKLDGLCGTCRERFDRNPLRALDCKEERCQALVKDAPSMLDMLCEDCAGHFEKLQGYLKAAGLPFAIDSRIVRGLDYYTKTVFELITKTPQGNLTVCGGGRYDRLVEELGGPQMPGVGFGMGMERILMLLGSQGITLPEPLPVEVYVAGLGEEAQMPAFQLTLALRGAGLRADCDHMGRSLKAQFKYADKLSAPLIAILGGDELQKGVVKIRNMATREETEAPLDQAAETLLRLVNK